MSLVLLGLLSAGIVGVILTRIKPGDPMRSTDARVEAMAAQVAALTGFDRSPQTPDGFCRLRGTRDALSVRVLLISNEAEVVAYLEITGAKFLPTGSVIRTDRAAARHDVTPSRDALPPGWNDLLTRWGPRDFHLAVETDCFSARTTVRDAQEVFDLVTDATQQLTILTRGSVYR